MAFFQFYLGSILYKSASVFFFSSVNWLVLSCTRPSRLYAYFSMMASMLSKILAFLLKERVNIRPSKKTCSCSQSGLHLFEFNAHEANVRPQIGVLLPAALHRLDHVVGHFQVASGRSQQPRRVRRRVVVQLVENVTRVARNHSRNYFWVKIQVIFHFVKNNKRTCVAQSDAAPGPVALEHLVEDYSERVNVSFLRSASWGI